MVKGIAEIGDRGASQFNGGVAPSGLSHEFRTVCATDVDGTHKRDLFIDDTDFAVIAPIQSP
jgi:hypothetical protein